MSDFLTFDPAWQEPALPLPEQTGELLRAFRRHGLASGHSDRTISAREYTIRRLLAADLDPLTSSADDLTEWLSTLRDSRTGELVTRSSKATYRAQVRAFFRWLHETGRRDDDPTSRLPRPRAQRGVPRPLSVAQVEQLLKACDDPRAAWTRAYVSLAAFAGLRVHEIAKIRGQDVRGGRLFVRGKGGHEALLPMHPLLVELAERMPDTGWWFPTSSQLGHVHRCSVSTAIKRAMDRAGVPGTPHALRHFYGTQVLKSSGGNLRTTQQAMRHVSIQSTAIYTLVDDAALTHAIGGIPAEPDAAEHP
ncbi:tyrosine-type recombinase/integrase [Flexivirga oryzae]|uniref:Integrase n=1 Tax=Flexivirga oryzae TaxID=1794944 RepID=A0A839N974_9MICO|nr:tyrosine-type recombinase/integrase [Flexivirga oryzae]MBB2892196.1 integrase [Flexivirga oryzae]